MHLAFIHVSGSESEEDVDDIDFYPYFYLKDLYAITTLILVFVILVFFAPNYLGHPDNYIPANNLVTPTHLVPEWYFLPFYAILRSTPDKFGGLLMMAIGIILMFDLSDNDDEADIIILIMLGVLGGKPVEEPYTEITQ
jgi:ubiquinol-cytochrome c reductase cytochrome b subunit